jgi:hypothetical protein
MPRESPIVWIIGATRSCKTALAQYGVAPLGFKLISTGDYFRREFGQEDTFSRDFVFQLSAFSATCLAQEPNCHLTHLHKLIEEAQQPCVIEGERNPMEFAKLYDPHKDMVIFLHRMDMDIYDTTIERGIAAIERNVRWCVNVGIAPPTSVFKTTFGDQEIKGEYFGVNNGSDAVFIRGAVEERKTQGDAEDRYPWINILIGMVREKVVNYFGGDLRPKNISLTEKIADQHTP